MTAHVNMEQLLAVRDGDRSEAAYAAAHLHVAECLLCRGELDRLHQRTARLRALPQLAPVRNEFPVVQTRLAAERRTRQWRRVASVALAAAAMLLVTVIGRDIVRPSRLDAEQQLQAEMSRSQQLEQTLQQINPERRVIDGRTAAVVIALENQIAALDAQLNQGASLARDARLHQELKLWRQRVGLMNALVDVHLTKGGKVDL